MPVMLFFYDNESLVILYWVVNSGIIPSFITYSAAVFPGLPYP